MGKPKLIIFLAQIFVTAFAGFVVIHALASSSESVQKEYEMRAKALKRRHQAYLEHERRLEREEQQRIKGIEKHKTARQKIQDREELARKRFIENRKPEPDVSEAEKKYLEMQAKREAELEKKRMRFVDRRDQLQRLLEKEVGIPAEKEVGLQ